MAKVKMYTTSWCVYCKAAKEFFKANNIEVQEIDVENDQKAQEEMIHKSGQLGVPVIDVDGQIFVGFDKRGLSKILNVPA
jgi:glutaredoxin-like YruB-family protein